MTENDVLRAALAAMIRSSGAAEIRVTEELVRETKDCKKKGLTMSKSYTSHAYIITLNQQYVEKEQSETKTKDNDIIYNIEVVLDD